ncbi:hypothetical protein CC77DRAFT_523941 [Alternaria alternata]|uniref:Uncharacterized protein n=1 Tax=Alternaria alternata TaxID=5599 RepID=A0A177DY95_ALTAL|nr:hypothetical protein CC77DRAFT_523941 [Alternaria alternata]OAG24466.1 hypothetical protein CC77DRAFT_523941 [Alternaria alternata]
MRLYDPRFPRGRGPRWLSPGCPRVSLNINHASGMRWREHVPRPSIPCFIQAHQIYSFCDGLSAWGLVTVLSAS